MNARALSLLGASELLRMRQMAAQALEEWRAVWGLGREEAQIACTRAWETAERTRVLDEDWTRWECDGWGWAAAAPTLVYRLQETLFGRSEPGTSGRGAPVALEVGDRAVDDLIGQLFGKGAPPGIRREAGCLPEISASDFKYGSGAAVIDIEIGEGRLRVLTRCGATRASSAPQARTGTQSPGESHAALHALPVTLEAELGELELDLSTLQSLEAGDVVRLTTRIDEPLRLSGPGGSTVCFGDFGAQEGFRALSLRKSAAHEGALT
jgi:flagellar motor switch/type III secretory pathway protein FliN